ncbi:hypothetical protein LCGC14_0615340 [marine sediment metagenome]|uniref:Uncharacterized protein n=1 Tax=marine sediment metagenome TaxID=412755 RepID=A0A0F9RBB1_9ZZZZ
MKITIEIDSDDYKSIEKLRLLADALKDEERDASQHIEELEQEGKE